MNCFLNIPFRGEKSVNGSICEEEETTPGAGHRADLSRLLRDLDPGGRTENGLFTRLSAPPAAGWESGTAADG